MKKILIIIYLLASLTGMAQTNYYTVSGTKVLSYKDNLHLDTEVSLVTVSSVSITYNGSKSGSGQWYRYNSSGVATILPGETTATLSNVQSQMGYYYQNDGVVLRYLWVVNYAAAPVQFESVTIPHTNDECSFVTLNIQKTDPGVFFYTHEGQKVSILRSYNATYTTWNENESTYGPMEVTEVIPSTGKVPAPMQDTQFKVFDVYAKDLDLDVSITSDEYRAIRVTARADEDIETRENDNEVAPPSGSFSAPLRVTFTAEANTPVAAFFLWTVYKTDESTTNPLIRYTDKVLRYTFERSGSYEVRLEVSDRDSKCMAPPVVFNYTIVESFIDVPNAFSPGTSPGVNDEFRVAYKSIVKFHASISTRWGNKIFEWSDPAAGWDGKMGGKYAPPGVYYYVIEATGSDGRVWKKYGHVNILSGK